MNNTSAEFKPPKIEQAKSSVDKNKKEKKLFANHSSISEYTKPAPRPV